ncbi:hypothetical protein NHH03_11315 [Stieleria sp. TO1_6]|uniref:hypothetical protein n=1 Tax=Stieleria tagensis TaxID=2956795 RepID=UPI00209AB8FD|nr:hypothetical protein [Stieleria tagensis]MCO8122330.1 hypothetical protein [Stieleria tagensis]
MSADPTAVPAQRRTAQTCLYRVDVRPDGPDGSDEAATCALLRQISGVVDPDLVTVCRAACDACCESYDPTIDDLNPIVASQLYSLTEHVISLGGVDQCDVAKARRLQNWAERSLPAVAPDEDDAIDLGRQVRRDYSQVNIDSIVAHLPRPKEEVAQPVKQWMVGMTTAPRRMSTLQQSLESVIGGGWESPTLFVDGPVNLPDSAAPLQSCVRNPAVGAFPNYILSLSEMFMRDPNADAYLLVQDDAMLLSSPATRAYLESVLWPIDGPCIASLYCSAQYTQAAPGWYRFQGNWIWGAVAFVFSPEALKQVLNSRQVLEHRQQPDDQGLSLIDVVIGRIAQECEIPIYYPSPSLVQHIGTISTIWKTGRAVNQRRADQFLGDQIE